MAKRPIFIPLGKSNSDLLVEEIMLDFKWIPGMAASQKRKNVASLHEAAKNRDIERILEVSTKSDDPVGINLSAFNLKVCCKDVGNISLESAFQGSKVFELGGPYIDMYGKNGKEIKKDKRLKGSGKLIKFQFNNKEWPLEPKTAFYDWLYLQSLHNKKEYKKRILEYKGFTDIEFNPKKSLNCQARSCALYVTFVKKEIIDKVLKDWEYFVELLSKDAKAKIDLTSAKQGYLF